MVLGNNHRIILASFAFQGLSIHVISRAMVHHRGGLIRAIHRCVTGLPPKKMGTIKITRGNIKQHQVVEKEPTLEDELDLGDAAGIGMFVRFIISLSLGRCPRCTAREKVYNIYQITEHPGFSLDSITCNDMIPHGGWFGSLFPPGSYISGYPYAASWKSSPPGTSKGQKRRRCLDQICQAWSQSWARIGW